MRPIRYWARVMRAGYRTVPAIVSYITMIVGGSVALAFPWGRKHLVWGIVFLLLGLVVVILEGSYQESLHLDQEHEGDMTRLRGEHEVALTAQRNEHQAAMNAALTAAVASRADATGRPDAADWNAYCDSTPGTLMFNLRHRFENRAAIMAFSQLRCTVTDPAGVRTEAVGTALFVQYLPYYFPGAPPVRDGTYAFAWDGLDAKGTWQRIKEGTCEVTGSPAGDAEAIRPGDA